MDEIKLYIGDVKVDLPEDLPLPITYTVEDLTNPTIVKNSFSKTIALPGTKVNNKVFGEIYKLDRMQHYQKITGGTAFYQINFDPSKRTPFAIYRNSDIIESGYMQLTDISVQNGVYCYNITLYGGLGDFFYNLKYKENGEIRQLKDLVYGIEKDGKKLNSDEEFNFRINKELVAESFQRGLTDGNELLDYLAFLPSNSGQYNDFDSSHCLINTVGQNIFADSISYDGKQYNAVNGFVKGTLSNTYTEFEMKDLRSYFQRPALRFKKLFKAICDNSGYSVQLDGSFFNEKNPYWEKSFVALPLLTSNTYDKQTEVATSVALTSGTTSDWVGDNTTKRSESRTNLVPTGISYAVNAGLIEIPGNTPNSANVDATFEFSLKAFCNSTANELMLSYLDGISEKDKKGAILAYLTIDDADGNQKAISNALQFQDTKFTYNHSNSLNQAVKATSIYGHYYKTADGYLFKSDTGVDTFQLNLYGFNFKDLSSMQVVLHLEAYNINGWTYTDDYALIDGSEAMPYYAVLHQKGASFAISTAEGVTSNRLITKKMLLKTEKSAADYLLDYCKLFGLYFVKDVVDRKISIYSRNRYYTGEVVDISKAIDYSKDLTVTPIIFDKKYYQLALQVPETRFSKQYKTQYEQDYGQQRVGTGYNFSSENTKLYEDNLYQTTLPILDSDRLFRTYRNASGEEVPGFVCDNVTVDYWNGDETASQNYYGLNILNRTKTTEWGSTPGCFPIALPCYYSQSDDSKAISEISSSLLLYNGSRAINDVKGSSIFFNITDDVVEMNRFNDKTPCFIWTTSEEDIQGNRIAVRVNQLPQYLNVLIDNSKNVTDSLDFGVPREVYCGKVNYPEASTLYYRYWMSYLNDQFSVDTKKVSCFVKMQSISQDDLRKFYYFGNSLWIISKVDSYDCNSNNTTRIDFIKVQRKENYTNGQIQF